MKSKWFRSIAALCAFSLLETATWASSHPRYKLLHTFHDMPAEDPCSTLISDSAGNLDGTSCGSLHDGGGVIYELSPTASGGWVYQVLHVLTLAEGVFADWQSSCSTPPGTYMARRPLAEPTSAVQSTNSLPVLAGDGRRKSFTPSPRMVPSMTAANLWVALAMDAQGNLYGGTHLGGTIMMELSLTLTLGSDGEWTETVLHPSPESEFGPQSRSPIQCNREPVWCDRV